MIKWLLIFVIAVSVGSKNLWPYFYDELYFQGNALAWCVTCCVVAALLEKGTWAYRIALILFWWSVNDVMELFFMARTAFDANEYITAVITIFIILFCGKRKKNIRSIQRTGY